MPPLTYFIDAGVNQNWSTALKAGATAWSDATSWTIEEANSEDEARVVIRLEQADPVLEQLVGAAHHRAHFTVTEWGYEEIFGLQKPCALKGEIVFFITRNPPVNRKNTAMHELGHALGLADTNDRSRIMHESEQALTTLSQEDIDLANQTSGRSNMNQFHNGFTTDGGVLAFAGVEARFEGGLSEATTVGIRPLSLHSMPIPVTLSSDRNRVWGVVHVTPEWSKDEDPKSRAYRPKQVDLVAELELQIDLDATEDGRFQAMPLFRAIREPESNDLKPSIAQWSAEDRTYVALETSREVLDGVLRLRAKAPSFGYFAVLSASPSNNGMPLLTTSLIAAIGLLTIAIAVFFSRGARSVRSHGD